MRNTNQKTLLIVGSIALLSMTISSIAIAAENPTKPVFAMYYMWWSHKHWLEKLGPHYPYQQTPNPLPATLDKSGCGTQSNYAGNVVTDISQNLSYDQDDKNTIEKDVRLAAGAGLTGFAVNWVGDGTKNQSPTSTNFNRRLQSMFDAVHKVNKEGIPFKVILNYQSSAVIRSQEHIANDMNYFLARYGQDAALDHTYSSRPEIIMAGTWKYKDAVLAEISQTVRPHFFLIGDEKPSSWNNARAASLDGTSYYWSSQNPYKNTGSFAQLQQFAATVRTTKNPDGSSKVWLAPFIPGYNAMLLYKKDTCVPRNNGQTMHALFDGNKATNPDGWTLISWNEISEGSYIVPLTRYGTFYVDTLKEIIRTNH